MVMEKMITSLYEDYKLIIRPESREIKINGPITPDVAAFFIETIKDFENEDPGSDITVRINSPGGSLTDGLAMINYMQKSCCEIVTVCEGMAASMGAMILMCGEKGKRRILRDSDVMIHQPLGGTEGQAIDIELYAANIKKKKEKLFSIICDATGQKMSKVVLDCDRNYTMSAQEALEYGIVDEIIGKEPKDAGIWGKLSGNRG